ncbi:alpha-2 adrenergic receptor [Trichonephila clavipes]|nr:alpha-2 adrenergic receptor [Trichonephila clavipes]
MIVQFRNEKVSTHGSIPITIDCNVVAFIVFKEGFHQPIKRTKQSVFLDVTVFDIHLWISFTPNAAVLFVDVAIQPKEHFIAKQNSLMKIGNNGNFVLGPFDESTPCLMIVLMNCQTKLRINHLTAVKSVAILEIQGNTRKYVDAERVCDMSESSRIPRSVTVRPSRRLLSIASCSNQITLECVLSH